MIGSGLRVGEITGLRWCDIDMDEGVIDVNHNLVCVSHRDPGGKSYSYLECHSPKTKASIRKVPMMGFVKEAFEMQRDYLEDAGLKCNAQVDGYTDFIFLNKDGNTLHQGTLNKALKRIIRDCNDTEFDKNPAPEVLLPSFSCHSLRHTFTTRCIEAGVNVKVLQKWLGHDDITTTLNIYADCTKEMVDKSLVEVEKVFESQAV
jgi:integrase